MLKLHKTLENAFPETYIRTAKYTSEACTGFITIDANDSPLLTFTIQEGAVNEHGKGVNGVQTEELMQFTMEYLKTLNAHFPCQENIESIKCLQEAINHQHSRSADRTARGVEGTSNQ